MQLPNKITVSQEVYDELLASKSWDRLDELGINSSKVWASWNADMILNNTDRDTAFLKALSDHVDIDLINGRTDGIETDAQFIAEWTAWAEDRDIRIHSGYVENTWFRHGKDASQWQYFDHLGRDTDALKQMWSAYLVGLSEGWRRTSGRYVEHAIKCGTLHTLYMPPTNGDPLE